jgi:hypothetical protein
VITALAPAGSQTGGRAPLQGNWLRFQIYRTMYPPRLNLLLPALFVPGSLFYLAKRTLTWGGRSNAFFRCRCADAAQPGALRGA